MMLVFSYSGFMLSEAQPIEAFICKKDGLELTVFPPQRVASATWRPIPQFDDQNIQKVFPGAPKLPLHRLAIYPAIGDDGSPTLKQVWGDDIDVTEYKDTFPIVVVGEGFDGPGQGIAEAFLQRVFAWLRVWTFQWWIGRPSEALNGNMHFATPVIKKGDHIQLESSPYVHGRGVAPQAGTRKVTRSLWKQACVNARDNLDPDIALSVEQDVHYYYGFGQQSTTIILVCSLFEILRDRALERHGVNLSELNTGSTDLLKHLSVGFGHVFEKDLSKELPVHFNFVKSCWIARGHAAHGKPMK
ncbi:MAG TPA: hypothetical protein VFP12_05705 [Allosphingosinicella sp.]|nr:hypothetical protein [Allosphingosinicella sp.]